MSKSENFRNQSIVYFNCYQVMRSTMAEFRNNDEYLDMWLAPTPKPRRYLSPYGTRRMFYALRQTVTAKSPQVQC